jgi:hypothetical protein
MGESEETEGDADIQWKNSVRSAPAHQAKDQNNHTQDQIDKIYRIPYDVQSKPPLFCLPTHDPDLFWFFLTRAFLRNSEIKNANSNA